jgi:hypothetical protein
LSLGNELDLLFWSEPPNTILRFNKLNVWIASDSPHAKNNEIPFKLILFQSQTLPHQEFWQKTQFKVHLSYTRSVLWASVTLCILIVLNIIQDGSCIYFIVLFRRDSQGNTVDCLTCSIFCLNCMFEFKLSILNFTFDSIHMAIINF